MKERAMSQARPAEEPLRHRKARVSITVTADGQPLSGQEVVIAQTRHAFLFGCGFDRSVIALSNGELSGEPQSRAARIDELTLELFNCVTLPFYWANFEPTPGLVDFERITNAIRWYRERGCRLKGHPLCWHTLAPGWLLPLDTDAIRDALLTRTEREVSTLAGQIAVWDVVNEAVISPVYERYDNGITRLCRQIGVVELIAAVFERARVSDPAATLMINDFDVSADYERLISDCLARGIRIDAIGIQSHMHQGYWGVERTQSILERFGRFGLPLHFTESTLVSGHLMPPELDDLNDYQLDEWPSTSEGEERQCRETELHYRTLFAHPLVRAVTWWELVDGGWLRAPAGLVRHDLSIKPAYEKLLDLIQREWWTPETRATTAADGTLPFAGFLGDYELASGTRRHRFSLTDPHQEHVTIRL